MTRSSQHPYHGTRPPASRAGVLAAVLAAAGAAGCWKAAGAGTIPAATPAEEGAAPPAEPLVGLAPHFVPGEQLTWEVTFLGIEGGRARMAIGEPGVRDGRTVVVAAAQAEAAGLVAAVRHHRDQVESIIDLDTGLPLVTESEADLQGRFLGVHATRRPGEPLVDLRIRRQGQAESRRSQRLPAVETHDPLSALLLIRGWAPADGEAGTFFTLGGLRLWRTELVAEARETIDTRIGRLPAVRVRGVSTRMTVGLTDDAGARPRTFTVWISDDERRIPLRVLASTEFGAVEARITGYEVQAPRASGR